VPRRLSNVIGIDDAPFTRHDRRVALIGAVFSRTRLDGVAIRHVRRDGSDATRQLLGMVGQTPFAEHIRAVLLQGITVAGFNVIDVQKLHLSSGLPVLVVVRRRPNLQRIRAALLGHVPGGSRKWKLIESAGPLEPLAGVFVQRVGVQVDAAERLLRELNLHGALPEPLRIAHLIAGAVGSGTSRGRA
jgi:endonuclease V-like protein UPF0215 family